MGINNTLSIRVNSSRHKAALRQMVSKWYTHTQFYGTYLADRPSSI